MARATINIPFVDKFGYVDAKYPNTNYQVTNDGEYHVTQTGYKTRYHRYFYCRLGDFPDALSHQRLYSVQIKVPMFFKEEGGSAIKDIGSLYAITCKDFNPNTLTYNTRPSAEAKLYASRIWPDLKTNYQQGQWIDAESTYTLNPKPSSDYAKNILTAKSFYLETLDGEYESLNVRYNKSVDDPEGSCYASIKTRLSDGSMPYAIVEYDDEETVSGKVALTKTIDSIANNAAVIRCEWEIQTLEKSETDWFCFADTWEQDSAYFYWQEQGAETWNRIEAGSNSFVSIPANTFVSGKTYKYYVSATDTFGNTTQTAQYTFSTPQSRVTPSNSPTSGYVNPRIPTSFGWNYVNQFGSVPANDTKLRWRVSGNETWTVVNAETGANSLSIPANAFPQSSTIEWYLSGSDITGYESESIVYSFSTSASSVKATPISPKNTIERNNQPLTFSWSYELPNGIQPSRYIFEWKYVTDVEWTTLIDDTNVTQEYTFLPYTFPVGEIQWRVIPYNIDGVAGTGNSASFICHGAPEAPAVYAENVPFSTVTWQANDQQAYQIRVDGTVYGPYFGTEKSFELPDYLEDGEHTIGVSVVGTYGMWSEWGESVITVQNDPGTDIMLTASGDTDVTLEITAAGVGQTFLIYRDDVLIGKTGQNTFTDRFVLGEHTYRVISKLPSGNYSTSNETTAEARVKDMSIAALAGGEWLPIPYSLQDQIDPAYEATVTSTYHHVSGSEYPSAVISPYRDLSVSGSALFLSGQRSEQKRFEELFGQAVIIKFRDGTVFVGVLDSWNREPNRWHYTAYTFTVRQIAFEDYVNDTE